METKTSNYIADEKKYLQNVYGWHWLANAVADWKKCSLDEIYDLPLCEVLNWSGVMTAKTEYNQLK